MKRWRALSVCAGIGGIDLALEANGIEVVAQVEIDDYCQQVLVKHWPDIPKRKDIRHVSSAEFGPIDLLVGGVPCQGNSMAGKRRGRDDERNLWPEFRRLLRESGARWAILENVRGLLSANVDRRGRDHGLFGDIQRDLALMGYTSGWCVLSAADAGAPHKRERIFLVAHRLGNPGSIVVRTGTNQPRDMGETTTTTSSNGQGPICNTASCSGNRDVADTGRSGRQRRGIRGGAAAQGEIRHTGIADGGEPLADGDDQRQYRSTQLSPHRGEVSPRQQLRPNADGRHDVMADTQLGGRHPGESGDAGRQAGTTPTLRSGNEWSMGDTSEQRRQRHGETWGGWPGSASADPGRGGELAHPDFQGLEVGHWRAATGGPRLAPVERGAGQAQSGLGRDADGLPGGLDRPRRAASTISRGRHRRRLCLSPDGALLVSALPPQRPDSALPVPPLPALWSHPSLRWPSGPGEIQAPWEPPRTITGTLPQRAARLKALGNAVVWPVAYWVIAAIVAVEEGTA